MRPDAMELLDELEERQVDRRRERRERLSRFLTVASFILGALYLLVLAVAVLVSPRGES